MAHVLWSEIMNFSASNPRWFNRDRFVLSNGHACALLYSMLHLTGYEMSIEDLKNFRQLNSVTAGHPENVLHPAIEVSTGPLGQGISNAVGMAAASKHVAARFNKAGFDVMDNFIYCICGDGCLQEGVSGESSSLAGHLGLGNLIVLYDDNKITIDGSTELSFTEDVLKRYEAYGWHTICVADGDADTVGIAAAIKAAKAVTDKPTMIKVSTTIGFGAGAKAGTAGVHGSPLNGDELAALKTQLGFSPEESFVVPEDVVEHYKIASGRGEAARQAWEQLLVKYQTEFPTEGAELARRIAGKLPENWHSCLPDFKGGKKDATRSSSGKVLNALAEAIPEIMGGSADLTPSNKTLLKVSGDFQKDAYANRYMRFGVREHGMAAIANGMAAYGGVIPYVATFLNFVGYSAGATRVGALSHLRTIYVATHDSIGLGEDGPTHQPVEMVTMLRAMPNCKVLRPADGTECNAAYITALESNCPSIICLSRQNLPQLEGSSVEGACKGAYVVWRSPEAADGKPAAIVIATGSEVEIAIAGAQATGLATWVVSAPCLDNFNEAPLEYRETVLPQGVPVVSVEASSTHGWARFSHVQVGLHTFGLSAPIEDVYKTLGITAEVVADRVKGLVEQFPSGSAPMLVAHYPDAVSGMGPKAAAH